jgi:N,N'-diacetyllegionaminate synthase
MTIDMTRTPPLKIIAELAQGFEGNAKLASLLIRAAARAGADGAKFQMVFADELATPDYEHYKLFQSLEMPADTWQVLLDEARTQNIELEIEVFGRRSLALAQEIGVQTIKLHGTDIANPRLLSDVAASSIPNVMLGAGGSLQCEIDTALEVLAGKQVILFLGFQGYPTPTDGNQIDRVRLLSRRYIDRSNVSLGFADHADPTNSLRFALASAAVGAGARVIEKHLTLGRNMELEDFESALNPDEFQEFVTLLHSVATGVGVARDTSDFGMSKAEVGYRQWIRRHVVAARELSSGQLLAPEDLVLKRSNSSEPLTDMKLSLGKVLVRDIACNTPLNMGDLKE